MPELVAFRMCRWTERSICDSIATAKERVFILSFEKGVRGLTLEYVHYISDGKTVLFTPLNISVLVTQYFALHCLRIYLQITYNIQLGP